MTHIWLKDEARGTERRAALTPNGAATLIEQGVQISVERSAKRVFADTDYVAAGCALVDAGSWIGAPKDALILGVKELPETPKALTGQFAHLRISSRNSAVGKTSLRGSGRARRCTIWNILPAKMVGA